jgi:ATP-binding cassette subfamily F protein 3
MFWSAEPRAGITDLSSDVLQVVTDILYLQHQKLTTYKGDYDTFEKTRDERLRNQVKVRSQIGRPSAKASSA